MLTNRQRRARHDKIAEDYDWTPEEAAAELKLAQIEEMWEDYENSHLLLLNYYRKAYRFEPLPGEIQRYLRNDPVADYEELYVLRD